MPFPGLGNFLNSIFCYATSEEVYFKIDAEVSFGFAYWIRMIEVT